MEGNYLLLFLVAWPMLGALVGYLIGRSNKTFRDYFAILVCAVEVAVVIALFGSASNSEPATFLWKGFAGFRIAFELDGFRTIYAAITAIMWLCTTMMSPEYFAHYRNRNRYYFFTLLTLGATMGVFLSSDIMTTFLFFEIMSFTSYVQVVHEETPEAIYASQSYMAVAVIGGLVMLMGIFILFNQTGTTDINMFYEASHNLADKSKLFIGALCMLFGFGSKAGMFPLHFWLPMAHPVAPAPASALLSGVLTKAGVFGILLIGSQLFNADPTMGMVILVLGVITMFLGAFLALFSIDLKRTLACSSVSQIGFILVGIGMQGILGEHGSIAIAGTVLHMINHSMFKLILFMSAGVIYMNTHKLNLNDIRGFGRKKPILMVIFALGALGIVGVPGFSGYISKTLIHESIVEEIWLFADYSRMSAFYQVVEAIFTLSGALTCAYMTKLFISIFIEKNNDEAKQAEMDNKKSYMKPITMIALVIAVVAVPIFGLFPEQTMIKLAEFAAPFMHGHGLEETPHFFQWAALQGAVVSIGLGIVIYFLIVRVCLMKKDENGKGVYINVWPAWLSLEAGVYRPGLAFLAEFFYYLCKAVDLVVNVPYVVVTGIANFFIDRYPEYDIKKKSKKRIEHYLQDHYDRLISISLTYGLVMFGVGLVVFMTLLLFVF